uniref:Uncharacterized protein n=1 Tax=viral metagenome TaxID=1070528 RepID=A0A6C0BLQ2_9ZZZZ
MSEQFRQKWFLTVEQLVTNYKENFPNGIQMSDMSRMPWGQGFKQNIIDMFNEFRLVRMDGKQYKPASLNSYAVFANMKPCEDLFEIDAAETSALIRPKYDAETYRQMVFKSGPNHPQNDPKMGLKICIMYLYYAYFKNWAQAPAPRPPPQPPAQRFSKPLPQPPAQRFSKPPSKPLPQPPAQRFSKPSSKNELQQIQTELQQTRSELQQIRTELQQTQQMLTARQ